MHPRLPEMPDVDEPFTFGVPLPVEALVPDFQLREGVLREPSRSGFVLGRLVDEEGWYGVGGKEKHLRGRAVLRGIGLSSACQKTGR